MALPINADCVLALAPHRPIVFFVLFQSLCARPQEIDPKCDEGEWNGDGPIYPEVRLEDQGVLQSIPMEERCGEE